MATPVLLMELLTPRGMEGGVTSHFRFRRTVKLRFPFYLRPMLPLWQLFSFYGQHRNVRITTYDPILPNQDKQISPSPLA